MSLERIFAALITQMEAVPGLGHLYAYDRVMIPPEEVKPGEVRKVFGIDDQTTTRGWSIRSWQWSRRGVTEKRVDLEGTSVAITHHLALRGYVEHNDAWQSEVIFRGLCDAIRAVLRSPHAIEPEAVITTEPQMQGEGAEAFVVLGETHLCHQAIITLDTQELVYYYDGAWVPYSVLDDASYEEECIAA